MVSTCKMQPQELETYAFLFIRSVSIVVWPFYTKLLKYLGSIDVSKDTCYQLLRTKNLKYTKGVYDLEKIINILII